MSGELMWKEEKMNTYGMSNSIDIFGAIGRVKSRASRLLPLSIVNSMNMLKSFVGYEIRITRMIIMIDIRKEQKNKRNFISLKQIGNRIKAWEWHWSRRNPFLFSSLLLVIKNKWCFKWNRQDTRNTLVILFIRLRKAWIYKYKCVCCCCYCSAFLDRRQRIAKSVASVTFFFFFPLLQEKRERENRYANVRVCAWWEYFSRS